MNFWVISCEHADRKIPEGYAQLFQRQEAVLETHRAYDPGAYALYRQLVPQASLSAYYPYTRLLIEPNRSIGHPRLFSEFSKSLPLKTRQELIQTYYLPYRQKLEGQIEEEVKKGKQVIHLGIHSFTPELEGEVRTADIGLLYDPANKPEAIICRQWQKILARLLPHFRIRMNYPYLGKADGFTTFLRRKYAPAYAGIEFELNQRYAGNTAVYDCIEKSFTELKGLV